MAIKLLVSDVDGTIVQTDKSLAPSTVDAASRLQRAGVKLAVVSARPPRGVLYIQQTLGLTGPMAGFNGGRMVGPDGTVMVEHLVPEAAARTALGLLHARGVQPWVFAGDDWLITDPHGVHVEHERRTIRFDAKVVDSFEPFLARVSKMVGVSDDAPFLGGVETQMQQMLGGQATAKRSQTYYLDVTAPEANKGAAVRELAKTLGLALEEVAVLGDMVNDVPMFEVAGFSVAMGNASDAVKATATAFVRNDNDNGGWAEAIDRFILPRATP